MAWSDGKVRDFERFTMNTDGDAADDPTPGGRMLAGHRHLRVDNTDLSADETAEVILAWLDDPPSVIDR